MSSSSRRRPDLVIRRLDALYAELPDAMGCKGKCVASCGSVAMTAPEQQRIRARGVRVPRARVFGDAGCPALVDGRCSVYDIRPLICRLWGASDHLPCPFGCVPDGGRLTAEQTQQLMARYKAITAAGRHGR